MQKSVETGVASHENVVLSGSDIVVASGEMLLLQVMNMKLFQVVICFLHE